MTKQLEFYKKVLEYPKHFQRLILALENLDKPSTASEVALEVKMGRNITSSNLNQLVRLKLLEKTRIGQKVYFKLYISRFLSLSTCRC